jgi:6-phosphofructokinase 1
MERVGILTGGGDAPALNAVIRAVVMRLGKEGIKVIGYLEGWRGVLDQVTMELTADDVVGRIAEGGTMIGSSRTNPFKNAERDVPRILESLSALELDALIAIGGDDTLGVADKLYKAHEANVVGVPKTIDNDLNETEFTFGFDTAVERVVRAIDDLVTTARSHRRVLVVEVMGRHAGWIAAYAGLASGADWTLVPEKETDVGAMCDGLKRARETGKLYNIVVASEGAKVGGKETVRIEKKTDAFGHVYLGGVGERLAKMIQDRTAFETRHVVLGHTQRGGSPTAWDRVLGTRYGLAAAECVLDQDWGKMVALQGSKIVRAPLEAAVGVTKTVDADFLGMVESFFA